MDPAALNSCFLGLQKSTRDAAKAAEGEAQPGTRLRKRPAAAGAEAAADAGGGEAVAGEAEAQPKAAPKAAVA